MKIKKIISASLLPVLIASGINGVFAKSTGNRLTEKTYYFANDTINSGGTSSSGEVTELAITSVPQYFYIDTVEADAIESVTLRSGYETNSAITSVYVYDNNGEAVTQEQLKSFCTDNSTLTKIGSVADSKTSKWGYRTAIISNSGVEKTEGSNYTLLDISEGLNMENITGKKALIVGIDGDIGTKGFFDYVKVKYSREVDGPTPFIETIRGNGIKDNTVEIDKENRSITVPVVPGTDISKLKPEIVIDDCAEASLTSGTWENGTITVECGNDIQKWSVQCVDRGNPVLNGFYADPNIVCFGDTYYIYPTTDGGTGWNSTYFKTFSSKDLVNWKEENVILDMKDVSWSAGMYCWAPTIAEKNGKYYFYFSSQDKDKDTKTLGAAVSDTPTGPFVDSGKRLVQGGNLAGQMIDPAVFTDDDGQSYLYWGNGGGLYAAKLNDDMISIDGEIKSMKLPYKFREAIFVIKRNGTYYFMWSANDTGEPTYEVWYGTSDSPMGEINGANRILTYENASDPRIKATGHHSVVNVPGTDEWYICYHRFNLPRYGGVTSKNSEAGNHREVCIDKMKFNADGSIKPVTATLEGITEPVKVSPVTFDKCEIKDDKLDFAVKVNTSLEADIYTAVYDNNGVLVKVYKNEMSGSLVIDSNKSYVVKAMAWEKDTMKPIGDAVTCGE